ncbi:HYR domain-containing protein [Corallococcus sp. AB049A]|nr:HYR domain-containing protein [Corallococcus sp. AB049A]
MGSGAGLRLLVAAVDAARRLGVGRQALRVALHGVRRLARRGRGRLRAAVETRVVLVAAGRRETRGVNCRAAAEQRQRGDSQCEMHLHALQSTPGRGVVSGLVSVPHCRAWTDTSLPNLEVLMASRHPLRLKSVLVAGLVLLFTGCTPTQMPEEPAASAPVEGSPPIDFQAVIRRVNQSLRSEQVAQAALGAIDSSSETTIDYPVPAPTRNAESEPVIAVSSSSGTYLVIWTVDNGGNQDVIGTRVTTLTGTVLDPKGIRLATGPNNQSHPSVATDGRNFLVTWDESGSVKGARYEISSGSRLGSVFSLSTAAGGQSSSAMAFDGTQYLVVWNDSRNGTPGDVYGTRVRASDGVVLDPAGIPIGTGPGAQGSPAVSFDGSRFLVAWSDSRNDPMSDDLYGARVDAAGTVLDPAGIPISTAAGGQSHPSIASMAGTFLVTWDDARDGVTGTFGARVRGSDGVVLDPQGLAIATGGTTAQESSAVASDGSRFLVVWRKQADILGRRVQADGALLDPGGVLLSTSVSLDKQSPSVLFDGTRFLVVWEHRTEVLQDIYGVRVRASDFVVLDTPSLLLSAANNAEVDAVVAAGTQSYLVVWSDDRDLSGVSSIYGMRLRATDGALLHPKPVRLGTGSRSRSTPSVAFAEGRFLVTWRASALGSPDGDIHGVRIRESDGAVLDAPDLIISAAAQPQGNPKVASGDGLFFVTWEDSRNGTGTDVYGARIRASDGAVLDADGIAVATGSFNESSPATAFGAGYFLVAWTDERNGSTNPDIHGARVRASDGIVVDSPSLPITTRAEAQRTPAVAFDGSHFLTVWTDQKSGARSEVYGARVRAQDGAVLDNGGRSFFANTSISKEVPAVAFDGNVYLLVWREVTPTSLQLMGGRLAPDLSQVDASRFFLSNMTPLDLTVVNTTPLSLASWGRGRFLAVYEPHDWMPGQFRVRFRLVYDPANGAKCGSNPDCTSRFCVEGVCCSSACVGGTCGSGTCTYPPATLTCPGDVVAEATSASGVPVSYPAASATGQPPLAVTYSQASGSVFALGGTAVTASLLDGAGRSASCGFSITVRDTTAPVLTCPGEVVVEAVGRTGAPVDFPAPTVTDAVTSAPALTLSHERGSTFPVGTTQVMATAKDAAGNSASCAIPVTVRDTTPPSLSCPADLAVEATSLQGANVTYAAASASDPVSDVTVEYSAASGSHFGVGDTQVRVRATDGAGNSASCTFTVTVSLPPPPKVTCPSPVLAEATSARGASVVYPAATPAGRGPLSVTYSQVSGTEFPLGSTSVSATVTDGLGRTDTCSFFVTVRDTQAPSVTCGPEVVVEATGPSGATVTFATPTATDAVTAPLQVELSHASGAVFPVGSTRVVATATDEAGNTSGCAFFVVVLDRTAPVLTCGANVVAEATGPTGAIVDFVAPSAVDAVTPTPELVVSHAPGSLFPPGITRVTATATDAAGNTSQCAFTVTVRDTTPPKVGCPAPRAVEARDAMGTRVDFFVATPHDTVTVSPSVSLSHPTGSLFPPGTTEVVLSATDDAGNSASCAFTITVQDTTEPVVTCPSLVQKEDAPPEGLAVDYPAAIAQDAVSVPTLSYSHASGAVFPVGTTLVTATATDASGNSATCTFPVRVTARVQPPDEPSPAGGFGCGASTSAGLSWSGLLMFAWGMTRRRRSRSAA